MGETIEFAPKPRGNQPWDVAIIGSGPSGFTAAIYTTRGAASTVIAAGEQWGGQLMLTTDVDNYPGFPEGVQGPVLMEKMRKQAERFGAEVIVKNADRVDLSKRPFVVRVGEIDVASNSLIVATGAETKWLGVPGEEKLRGRGVSSCAPCDAPFFKDKKVLVVGGGDSAMEEALVLTKYATEVLLVHRRSEFKASVAMQKKVLENKKIKIIWDSIVEEFSGDSKLESARVKNVKENEERELKIDGAFVAIGHIPATDIFKGHLELDEKGYIKKIQNPNHKFQMSTSVEGVFVAGDVHDYHYRQAITAAGFGCMAGMDALKYLDKNAPVW